MKGSTPNRSKCVVPPIQKLWPVKGDMLLDFHTSLHLEMNQFLFMGMKEPSSVSKPNRWPETGALLLLFKWFEKAHCVLHPESVHIMNSPWGFVFVWGAQKVWNIMLEAVHPDFWGVSQCAFNEALNVWSTQTSLMWHWHQNAIVATANTAVSKVSFKFKFECKAHKCARVTGAHLGRNECRGSVLLDPCDAQDRCATPCQGAEFSTCQSLSPKSQVCR